ncbi:hypothetical protein HBB16_17550 [Pseudonocardia sp. MCCB 268]|nr:hypothetical protein [Pseudonocardia cytotoxica]
MNPTSPASATRRGRRRRRGGYGRMVVRVAGRVPKREIDLQKRGDVGRQLGLTLVPSGLPPQ